MTVQHSCAADSMPLVKVVQCTQVSKHLGIMPVVSLSLLHNADPMCTKVEQSHSTMCTAGILA